MSTSPRLLLLLQRPQVMQLYRQLLREAERFPQYNFRDYALRKIRAEFEARHDLPADKIPDLLCKGSEELQRLRRMTSVASLYVHDKLVIENNPTEDLNISVGGADK